MKRRDCEAKPGAGVTAAEAKTVFQMTVIPPRWRPYGVIGNSNKRRGKHSFTACERSLEKREGARGRSSLNLHRKYKQNQSSEATLPWVRLWWEPTDACRFKFTHAYVHVCWIWWRGRSERWATCNESPLIVVERAQKSGFERIVKRPQRTNESLTWSTFSLLTQWYRYSRL